MERTLDDSANRRLVIPQSFLAVDAILMLYENVVRGLVVYPQVIERHLREELPFMATENILMAAVAAGGDRQDLHERIRQHSLAAAETVKLHGNPNDLLSRLSSDPAFQGIDFDRELNPRQFVGCAPEQVTQFVNDVIQPLRRELGPSPISADIRV
jgi:adenylosuccinate lyase